MSGVAGETRVAARLRYGFSTLGCPQASWAEIVQLVRGEGFAGVELRLLEGEINLVAALGATFGNPDRMAAATDRAGIEILALASSQRLLGDAGWSEVVELARWADAAGVGWIRVFDGKPRGDRLDERDREEFLGRLRDWSAVREREGIRCDLMVETHSSLTRAGDCAALAEALAAEGVSLNLLWDVFHTWIGGETDPVAAWGQLRPWVRHIHLKDGTRDGGKLTLPGEGEMPVVPLLRRLASDGFAGGVSLEWEWQWNKHLPPLGEALRSGRERGWW